MDVIASNWRAERRSSKVIMKNAKSVKNTRILYYLRFIEKTRFSLKNCFSTLKLARCFPELIIGVKNLESFVFAIG